MRPHPPTDGNPEDSAASAVTPDMLVDRLVHTLSSAQDSRKAIGEALRIVSRATGAAWSGLAVCESPAGPVGWVAGRGTTPVLAGCEQILDSRILDFMRGSEEWRAFEQDVPVNLKRESATRPAALQRLTVGEAGRGVLACLGRPGTALAVDAPEIMRRAAPVFAAHLRQHLQARELDRFRLFGECSEQVVARIATGATEIELYSFLARFLCDAFRVDRAAFRVLSDDRQWFVLKAGHNIDPGSADTAFEEALPLREMPNILARLVADGMIHLEDAAAEPIGEKWRRVAQAGYRSVLAVPLADSRGEVWGMAILYRHGTGPVLPRLDIELFQNLIRHVSPMLHNARLLVRLQRSLEGFKVLFDTSREVSSVLNMAEVPAIAARRAMQLSAADEGMLLLLEPGGEVLRPILACSEYADQMMQVRCRLGEGITGCVAQSRVGEIINRADLDPRSLHVPGTPVSPEAMLVVPLLCADRLVGVLSLYKLNGREFSEIDLATINIFATQAAIAIENARLFGSVAAERTRLSTMVREMDEAVFLCDSERRILLENEAARRLAGQDGSLEGRSLLSLADETLQKGLGQALDELARESTRNVTREFNSGGRLYLGSLTAIREESEGLTGLVVLIKDVTDMRQLEAQLLRSNKMSAVGQLATGVAHEFNNLIAAIYGYAQFMKDNRDEKLLAKGINIILTSSERARDLTQSLLSFSRNRDGRLEAVDLNEVVDGTLLLVEQQLGQEGIVVRRESGRLQHAMVDRGSLQEVLLNLISNARDAMAGGGMLTVTTRAEGESLVIEVSDTGQGISPAHLERIFDPFFTTKGPLNGVRTPGIGLGLFTVYNVMQSHGGQVEVKSEVGKGTTFRLLLPRRPQIGVSPVRPAVELRKVG